MNMLKEKRTLIEWEKELDIWLIDLLPNEHFVEYTKMDAFLKIGISNIKRNWGWFETQIYNDYKNRNYRLNGDSRCVVIDNRILPLIEWEKEFGYWITNISINDHFKKCSKEQAIQLLKYNYFKRAWNEEANCLYMNYILSDNLSSAYKNETISIRNLNNVKIVPSVVCQKNITKKINNTQNVINTKVVIQDKKNITSKRKIKIRPAFFKKALAVTLSLVTAISSYGFIKRIKIDNIKESETLYSNSIDDNKCNSSTKESQILNLKVDNNNYKENKNNNYSKENKKEDISYKNIIKYTKAENDINEIESANEINIGDQITVNEGSYIYDNMYSAIDKVNGYDSYYSYDSCRNVNYIVLDYNSKYIFTNDIDEIENYKSKGASVLTVCTDDGFYNIDDVKVKVKKSNI